MVELIDNGRVLKWEPSDNEHDRYEKLYNYEHDEELTKFEEEINPNNLKFKCSNFEQFLILFRRASKQIYRNKVTFQRNFLLLIESFKLNTFLFPSSCS